MQLLGQKCIPLNKGQFPKVWMLNPAMPNCPWVYYRFRFALWFESILRSRVHCSVI